MKMQEQNARRLKKIQTDTKKAGLLVLNFANNISLTLSLSRNKIWQQNTFRWAGEGTFLIKFQ